MWNGNVEGLVTGVNCDWGDYTSWRGGFGECILYVDVHLYMSIMKCIA